MSAGAAPRRDERRERSSASSLAEQARTLGIAVLLALAIRAFVIEPFTIPSGSMLPTLLIGDHLFVNKFVYGIQVPFTDLRLPGLRGPERGEVVVFTVGRSGPSQHSSIVPADRRPDLRTEEFVKRIIGLPGETIEVRNGRIFVDGEPLELRDTGETFEIPGARELALRCEAAGNGAHPVLDDPLIPPRPMAPIRVEEGRYFVMGDNRDHSNDSRRWGTVRLAEIKGPAFILYWSWDFNGRWLELLNPITWVRLLATETRWDRIGDSIRPAGAGC